MKKAQTIVMVEYSHNKLYADREDFDIEFDDDRSLMMMVTHEGVIFDSYRYSSTSEETHTGTMGMTFDEWFDKVEGGWSTVGCGAVL